MFRRAIFFLVLFTILLSCIKEKMSFPPENLELTKNYAIIGVIKENYFKIAPIKDATVQIGSLIDTTDILGEFRLNFSVAGNYNLTISHKDYIPFDSTITINETNQKIDFILDPKLADFFPLKVGNIWTYDYSYRYRYGGSGTDDRVLAERTWEIMNISEENGLAVYTVKDYILGKEIRAIDWYSRYDTTALDTTIFFKIKQVVGNYRAAYIDEEGKFVFLKRDNMPNGLKFPLSPGLGDSIRPTVWRYHPIYVGDTLRISPDDYDLYPDYYIRDKGIYIYEIFLHGNHNYHAKILLKNVDLK